MRGPGESLTIGERIAFYRARRGYTQTQLANLVGRGADWLSKIERGERQPRNVEKLAQLARVLRVTLTDLIGQPVLMEDEQENDDIPAVRDALMTPRRLSRVLYGPAVAPTGLDTGHAAELVEFLWSDYQRGRLGRVVSELPGLIRTAQQLEDLAGDLAAESRRRAWATSARSHHLAATTLSKVGEADLSWIAAERAMRAADEADDPLVLASAARAATHALLAIGRFEDALSLGETAASWLEPKIADGDPAALSLYGMLHLRTAVSLPDSRTEQPRTACSLEPRRRPICWAEDANYWHTGFGPTNVELHRLSAGLDLGDISYVAERGPRVRPENLPAERRVTHMIDVARALSLLAKDSEALHLLLSAERTAPQLVRHNASVRETVKAIHRRAPVTGSRRSSELLALAQRCRAIG